MKTAKQNAARAAESLAHLYVFGAIVDLLEGGSSPDRQSASADRACKRIIAICAKEQQRCLRDYDAAIERLAGESA